MLCLDPSPLLATDTTLHVHSLFTACSDLLSFVQSTLGVFSLCQALSLVLGLAEHSDSPVPKQP